MADPPTYDSTIATDGTATSARAISNTPDKYTHQRHITLPLSPNGQSTAKVRHSMTATGL
jgi:hypothetical protein